MFGFCGVFLECCRSRASFGVFALALTLAFPRLSFCCCSEGLEAASWSHPAQCVVQRPSLGVQCRQFMPNLAVHCKGSFMLTDLSRSSSAKLFVASSALRMSNVLRVRGCALPQIAIALRSTDWMRCSGVGVNCMLSTAAQEATDAPAQSKPLPNHTQQSDGWRGVPIKVLS